MTIVKDAGITAVALLSDSEAEDWEEAESLFSRNGIRQVQVLSAGNLFQYCQTLHALVSDDHKVLIYCEDSRLGATVLLAYLCLYKRSVHFQRPDQLARNIQSKHPVMEADVSAVEKVLLAHRQFQGRQRYDVNLAIDKTDQTVFVEEEESAAVESLNDSMRDEKAGAVYAGKVAGTVPETT